MQQTIELAVYLIPMCPVLAFVILAVIEHKDSQRSQNFTFTYKGLDNDRK